MSTTRAEQVIASPALVLLTTTQTTDISSYVHFAESFTQVATWTSNVPVTSTFTRTFSPAATSELLAAHVVRISEYVKVNISIDVPLSCENLWNYSSTTSNSIFDSAGNPDIAGIGILLAFLMTAAFAVSLTTVAYAGGIFPSHYLRRVDKFAFRANSRNEESQWRAILESIILSLSDQQLVTGFAILIAGFFEMFKRNLSIYHWNIVVYLAWLSSSVHIASLTTLRDVLNRSPKLRNLRVISMLGLLMLLLAAMWPTRFNLPERMLQFPARCMFDLHTVRPAYYGRIDKNWILTLTMLLCAYVWKISQLFPSSRSWARKWLLAKPEAAMERFMRFILRSEQPKWVTWLPYKASTVCYIIFVAYAEFADSFIASILYICLALSYGIAVIFDTRYNAPEDIKADEAGFTFGQLLPLILVLLPAFSILELSLGAPQRQKKPSALYSLLSQDVRRPSRSSHPDLASALRVNEASEFEHKMNINPIISEDPIVDHLMSSRAFMCIIWALFAAIASVGLAVTILITGARTFAYDDTPELGSAVRYDFLSRQGGPAFAAAVPGVTLLVLPFSRRLK